MNQSSQSPDNFIEELKSKLHTHFKTINDQQLLHGLKKSGYKPQKTLNNDSNITCKIDPAALCFSILLALIFISIISHLFTFIISFFH